MQTILLVDDEQGILSALKRLFRHKNYVVHTALGGREALELLAEEKVDLIISDMRMPEMDGAEFLQKARESYPMIERILLTGFSEMELTVRAINDGGIYGYLSKPWDNQQVLELVENALEKREQNKFKNRALHAYKRRQQALSVDLKNKEREIAQNVAFVDFAHKQLNEQQAKQEKELALSGQFVDSAYQQLRDSYTVTEQVLVNLLDLRCKGQRSFGLRVVNVVDQMSRTLNLERDKRNLLVSAAKLHGVGKVGITDFILTKPIAKLSDEELIVYQGYPETGACTLMAIETYQDVAQLLFQQKEYLDGSGFPHGLRGDEISDLAQILTVAIDYAECRCGYTTGERMNHEKALSMLHANMGRYNANVLACVAAISLEVEDADSGTEIVLPVMSLRPGMVLQKDIESESGVLMLKQGAILEDSSIDHLANLEANMKQKLTVSVRLCVGAS